MKSDPVLQAILLLCSYFSKNDNSGVKPLSPTEYSRVALWLRQRNQTPADLLTRGKQLVEQWQDPKQSKNPITQRRLTDLLRRSASMAFAVEKWRQQNLWILRRADRDYPKVLQEKLGDTRSPLLYCIGNKELLSSIGIGFVGSRNTDKGDAEFTRLLAQQAVKQDFVIISGGAKGIDQTSMMAAVEAGGSAIGILADSLLRAATKAEYRKALKDGRLLLMTPYYPEASFSIGNAMGRNKYIYVLSKGVVVAKSDEKGGTWSGANENLKKQWVPLWVRDIQYSGNERLIELGGTPLAHAQVDFKEMLCNAFNSQQLLGSVNVPLTPDLFAGSSAANEVVSDDLLGVSKPTGAPVDEENLNPPLVNEPVSASKLTSSKAEMLSPFLYFFYWQLRKDNQTRHTPDALVNKYPELRKTLITEWLKTLNSKGLLKREGRQHIYSVVEQTIEVRCLNEH